MKMMSCRNPPERFCYVCGKYMMSSEKIRSTTNLTLVEAYQMYFQMEMVVRNEWWQPRNVCNACYLGLLYWQKRIRKSMPFNTPMIWKQPVHPDNCYFCGVGNVQGLTKAKKKLVVYPDVST